MFGCSGRRHDWQHFQACDSITSALGASTGKQQALASKQPEGAVLMICAGQPLDAGHAQCAECQEPVWVQKGLG